MQKAEPSALQLCEELNALHDAMLQASRALEWDTVSELEGRCAALSAKLATAKRGNAADVARGKALLTGILAKRHEIVSEIVDWQRDVEPMLRTFGKLPG